MLGLIAWPAVRGSAAIQVNVGVRGALTAREEGSVRRENARANLVRPASPTTSVSSHKTEPSAVAGLADVSMTMTAQGQDQDATKEDARKELEGQVKVDQVDQGVLVVLLLEVLVALVVLEIHLDNQLFKLLNISLATL